MNTTLLCQRSAARSWQTHTRLVQLAQRSQENEGVSSGRCEVNNCVCVCSIRRCVCLCIYRVWECMWVLLCVRTISSVFVCVHTAESVYVAALSPVHNAVSVESHKVDLTAATWAHWCKKHLKRKKEIKKHDYNVKWISFVRRIFFCVVQLNCIKYDF